METKKILIIDDDVKLSQMVQLGLQETGRYEVDVENRPRRWLTKVRAVEPDLILLDLLMLQMSGPEIIEQIEQDPALKDIPIIILTGTIEKEDEHQYQEALGNRPVIAKPANIEEIIDCIEENLVKAT